MLRAEVAYEKEAVRRGAQRGQLRRRRDLRRRERPDIFIGIPVFNRLSYVSLHARALAWMRAAGHLRGARVEVLEDSSTEFSLSELRAIYAEGADRVSTSVDEHGYTRLGADGNTFSIWRRFAACSPAVCGDYLLILDSDALLSPHWRRSLFDDPQHPYTRALMAAAFDLEASEEAIEAGVISE